MNELIRLHRDIEKLALQLLSYYESKIIEPDHAGMSAINELSEKFLNVLAKLEKRITSH